MSASNTSHNLTQWVEDYTQDLLAYTLSKVSDREQAEDLVQETFTAAVKALPKFEGKSAPKTWLIGILKRKIADFYRKESRSLTSHSVGVENLDVAESFYQENGAWRAGMNQWSAELHLLDDKEFIKVFKSCMCGLPSNWSYAIQQKFIEGESASEICKVLDITPTNYWQIVRRAKLNLKSCLEKKWFIQNK
jgi:RNA polymerase sigma-70 factor (ECF subfamily)